MNKLNIVLLVLAFITGVVVVTVQDQSRQYFIVLSQAEKQEVKLEQDYARLKLEQARLSNKRLAELGGGGQLLHPPMITDTRVVEMSRKGKPQ